MVSKLSCVIDDDGRISGSLNSGFPQAFRRVQVIGVPFSVTLLVSESCGKVECQLAPTGPNTVSSRADEDSIGLDRTRLC